MELKPCPFCGGDAYFAQTSYGTDAGMVMLHFQIRCKKCEASAPDGNGVLRLDLNREGEIHLATDDRSKAAQKWNRRANDDADEATE